MTERPGSTLAARPLHFFILADCSGSMAADGKMQALNNAIRETVPHLVDVAGQNPHAALLVRSIAFSTGAHWHVEQPTPVDELVWEDLSPGGYTDLGAALDVLASELSSSIEQRALPPAILLVSDGMPTDDYKPALSRFLDEPMGRQAARMAVGIGRDADLEVLERFVGSSEAGVLTANNPEQLVRMIRWASTHASRVASNVIASGRAVSPLSEADVASPSELVW